MDGGGVQRSKRLSNSCILLIVIAGMERFAFKGVASNLVTYLTDVVKMTNSSAAKTVNSWCGLTSMLPLLVAPLADSYWGRFSTILASSIIYIVGLTAVTSTALTWTLSTQNDIISSTLILFGSLCLISFGQGGFNPSLQAFGADELENDNDEELTTIKDDKNTTKKSLFFTWWYFGVCSGSLLGVIVMAYIQDTFGWVLGFAIPTIAMVLSVLFFVFGIPIYQTRVLGFKSVLGIGRIIKAINFRLLEGRVITLSNDDDSNETELEMQKKPLCDHQSKPDRVNPKTESNMLKNSKVLLRLLPIWTTLLMFAVIFQQPATFFTKQGMTMKRNIGGGDNFKIPPSTLQSAITLSIILLMPLYNKLVTTRQKNGIHVMTRMGIGMFLSIIAMVVAAIVETKRLDLIITTTITTRKSQILEPKVDPETETETVDLSIFWLLPQYVLLGVSDIFTVVGMQEFFYNEVPVRMRTMGFALYTSVFGVGSFLSALLISVVEVFSSSGDGVSWFSDDMAEARLDKYYWLLVMASVLSLVVYVILCKFYKSMCDLNDQNPE